MLINIGRRAALVLGRRDKAEAALRRLWIVTRARASPRKRIDGYAPRIAFLSGMRKI